MTPLFRKLNLTTQSAIHVLDAPDSFEPELSALEGIDVRRKSITRHPAGAISKVGRARASAK